MFGAAHFSSGLTHSITFADPFMDGNTYTAIYEVAATLPNFFTQLRADIDQTIGFATLSVMTVPGGSPAITFVKTSRRRWNCWDLY